MIFSKSQINRLQQILVHGSIYGCLVHTIYAITIRPAVCLSFCLSVTWVDQSKTLEVRIMQFSPYGSPIYLVFVG